MAEPDSIAPEAGTIAFGQGFAASEAFKTLFREGMALVEEAAAYLDGPGREESRALPRVIALAYANESMRLTTRLMQIASWLLVQRSVAEGELSRGDARGPLGKLRLSRNEPPLSGAHIDVLPKKLVTLIESSLRLQARIIHVDGLIKAGEGEPTRAKGRNAVALQHMLIRSAFTRQDPLG